MDDAFNYKEEPDLNAALKRSVIMYNAITSIIFSSFYQSFEIDSETKSLMSEDMVLHAIFVLSATFL
jgi:hypothetical protein